MPCDPTTAPAQADDPDVCEHIALELGERGWCVTPHFIPPLLVSELRREALELHAQGGFRPAGIGRGEALRFKPEVRTDRVYWLDPGRCSGPQRLYLGTLETLRQTLNQTLLLGLFEYAGHFALYPPGTYYRKHLDQFVGMGLRTVTLILYLNPDWEPQDGGQLRIYCDPRHPDYYEELLPLGGQLVTFLSARYLHEVMPSRRDRVSITGWLSRRGGDPF